MYQIFFQPFEATEAIKKGSNRAFTLMLVIGCALLALAGVLFMQAAPMGWAREMMKDIPWSPLASVQYFLIFFVTIFVLNLVRSFLVHLVMHIFTDKGTYMDALKVMTVNIFLMSVYILLAIIAGAIPMVGMGLAALVFLLGVLITLAVTVKGLTVLYKTEIVTTWIALSLVILTVMCAAHVGLVASGGHKFINGKRVMMNQSMMPYGNSVVNPQP